MNQPIGLIGLGSVGGAFAHHLGGLDGSDSLLAWTRNYERREVWARRPGVSIVEGPEEVARYAGTLLICVTDDAILEVAERCAAVGPGTGRVVLHTGGSVPADVLERMAEAGWSIGVIHPLRPVVGDDLESLAGAAFGLFGDEAARAAAREIVAAVDGHAIEMTGQTDGRSRDRYHAAAALMANGLVGLFAQAVDEFEKAGASAFDARTAVRSLMARSAWNLAHMAPENALTGPLRRGDVARVEAHLAALDPASAATYRALSRRLLALVGDDLEPVRRMALETLLEDSPS